MRNGKTAEQINQELKKVQEEWYNQLPEKFKDREKFSHPFFWGVSEKAWNEEKPLIMYMGEEARNWTFKDKKDIQKYAIDYLERQVYGASICKKNRSPFWTFIRKLNFKEEYNICWNNLDKLHRVVKATTKPLTYGVEKELHEILCDGKSLLVREIEIVKPDFVIFMGKAYNKSMAWAMGENYKVKDLNSYKPSSENFYVSEVKEIPESVRGSVQKMIWMYHPRYIQGQGARVAAIEKIQNILKR